MEKNTQKKISICFLILLISISFFLVLCFHIDSDYFWHIKAGEYMFKNGILHHDVFSWFVQSKYWMSHEWLFEIILYCLKCIFGKNHVFFYSFFSVLGLFSIFYFSNRKNIIKNIPYTLILFVFLVLMMIPFMSARPHLLSFCFLSLTISFLYEYYQNEQSKKLFFLPVISILWSNIHGGSSNLIYLFCFLFAFIGLFSFRFSKIEAERISKKQIKTLLLIGFLCIIGITINIHGLKMLLYPYQNMMDTTMIANIKEWQPTNLSSLYHYVYYLFILGVLLTMIISKKKIQLIDFILFLLAIYLGLKSVRFWMYTFILIYPFIFSYVSKKKIDKNTSIMILALSTFLLVSFLITPKNIPNHLYLNDEIILILQKEKPKRLFNMYDYGGELIDQEIKVFIDGRADLYGKYNYQDYLDICNLRSNTIELIQKYQFDYYFVSNEYPISFYLNSSSQYEKLYSNKEFSLYRIKD